MSEPNVVDLPGIPGTGPGSDIAIMMQHGSIGAGGFIPSDPNTVLRTPTPHCGCPLCSNHPEPEWTAEWRTS